MKFKLAKHQLTRNNMFEMKVEKNDGDEEAEHKEWKEAKKVKSKSVSSVS